MKVAFVGHRRIEETEELKNKLKNTLERLIKDEHADTFYFGSRSDFNSICYNAITELKERYPQIRRIYVRAEYEYAYQSYIDSLLSRYEETFFPKQVHGAGQASYIKRNQIMVDFCDVFVTYCDKNYLPKNGKSGTMAAVDYAKKKGKRVVNLFESG